MTPSLLERPRWLAALPLEGHERVSDSALQGQELRLGWPGWTRAASGRTVPERGRVFPKRLYTPLTGLTMATGSGARLGPYVLGPVIGSGGMGEVYRAHDSRLGRDVAIKILPPDVADDPERLRRFESEARAAAALNHPNILVVHDVGRLRAEGAGQDREDDISYLVTELLEGRTLREVIEGGAVALPRALDYAVQIADGLAAAHARGIVHRDLKPENVFVTTDGRVKILDFGLAKTVTLGEAAAAGSTVTAPLGTAPHVVLGTPGYMAPEQVRGEPVDPRADIFAFGCVLYELLGGRPAFRGATTLEVLSAILRDTPAPPASLSPALARVVERSLEKDPGARFQSARDLAFALRGLTGGPRVLRPWAAAAVLVAVVLVGLAAGWWGMTRGAPPSPRLDSLAVLPFANRTGDPGQQHFVDAMHDAVIAELAQIGALTVISRQSVLRYRDTDRSIPQIARELGVSALLEGSVFRAGDSVRITVTLLQARPTERHLWADTFQRDLGGILTLHGEVARAIAERIEVAVTPEELRRLARDGPVDPAAYQAWLRGWVAMTSEVSGPAMERCIAHAEEAATIDPEFARAHSLAAACYNNLTYFTPTPPQDAFPKAQQAAQRAIDIDPGLGPGYAALAWALAVYEWDWSGADHAFRRGIKLAPSDGRPHGSYGFFLAWMGRHEEAIEHARRAEVLNPGLPGPRQNLAMVLYLARRYDEAIEQAQRTIDLAPTFGFAHARLAGAYEAKGMYEEAVIAWEQAVALMGDGDVRRRAFLARAYGLAGRRDEALRILSELLTLQESSYVPPTAIAPVYVGLGQLDEAMAWLERGYDGRDGDMVLLNTWPVLDPLRSDPRFQRLLRRMNFPR
jgi:eukaryotic-like serine/threonine-protein kinase